MSTGFAWSYRDGQHEAANRRRVVNVKTGKAGNLVDWLPGDHCRVFVGYDSDLAGFVRMPVFEAWPKVDCRPESPATSEGGAP